jgi:hypothetical protein
VYRKIWGWPLRSTGHLIATAILLGIVGALVAFAVPNNGKSSAAVTASSSVSATPTSTTSDRGTGPLTGASTSASSSVATRLTAPVQSPTSSAPAPAALDVALSWAKAWVDHPSGMTTATWLQNLKPYTTDEFLPTMSTIDLANIPSTTVTGTPTVVNSYTGSVDVTIQTDAAKLSLTIVNTQSGWRVNAYDLA